jgi:ribosomal protein L15, bacterial/organelle
MDILSNLKYAEGSHSKKKRIGRGEGSGHGGTSTKGMNGQLSRSGSKHKAWFEGGQMPLQRRVPKFGFTNIFKVYNQVLNLGDIQKAIDEKKISEGTITLEVLYRAGVISSLKKPVKILGNGEIKSKIKIDANAFSESAKEKIEAVGGSINKI